MVKFFNLVMWRVKSLIAWQRLKKLLAQPWTVMFDASGVSIEEGGRSGFYPSIGLVNPYFNSNYKFNE